MSLKSCCWGADKLRASSSEKTWVNSVCVKNVCWTFTLWYYSSQSFMHSGLDWFCHCGVQEGQVIFKVQPTGIWPFRKHAWPTLWSVTECTKYTAITLQYLVLIVTRNVFVWFIRKKFLVLSFWGLRASECFIQKKQAYIAIVLPW